ncbi:MAG: DUF3667 domain-containing protein [Gammaproteobacteria bacterium]|nr:MAG: DUF3667 domain-containing protein [Gammaproteobacteria bacterium]
MSAVPVVPAAHCENCGAPVSARYCSACGQRLEPPVHSVWHFTKVAFEDLTHADSRLWRTLTALLFKPGYLTREFLAGRRARYLPPVRLYLVLSVVFFLAASATHGERQVVRIHSYEHGAPGESAEGRAERLCRNEYYNGPWKERFHQACVRSALDNGRSLEEAFLHNLPRAMFLFLPLLAAAMMLVYRRPRHYYVEHLLLFLHNHAFVFLIAMLAWAAGALLPVAAGTALRTAVFIYVLWYVYRSMRVVYGQGRALTFAKLLPLSFFYLASGVLMLAITSIYSVLTL